MRLMMLAGMIALTSGCSLFKCEPIPTEPVRLPIPMERPKPKIAAEEVRCLATETRDKLMIRDAIREAELHECIEILKSTH